MFWLVCVVAFATPWLERVATVERPSGLSGPLQQVTGVSPASPARLFPAKTTRWTRSSLLGGSSQSRVSTCRDFGPLSKCTLAGRSIQLVAECCCCFLCVDRKEVWTPGQDSNLQPFG